MKYLFIILLLLCSSCMKELDDFDHEKKVFDKNLVGFWLLNGKMDKSEYGNVSVYNIKSLSIDSSGVFLFEEMQLGASTSKPNYVSKYAGSTLTENGEITLTAKRSFLFNLGFESEYSEWKKVDKIIFEKYSFKIQSDSLHIEDLRDDIIGSKEIFIKIN